MIPEYYFAVYDRSQAAPDCDLKLFVERNAGSHGRGRPSPTAHSLRAPSGGLDPDVCATFCPPPHRMSGFHEIRMAMNSKCEFSVKKKPTIRDFRDLLDFFCREKFSEKMDEIILKYKKFEIFENKHNFVGNSMYCNVISARRAKKYGFLRFISKKNP